MIPANYDHWKNKKLWTIYELAFLLNGFEPTFREDRHSEYQKVDPEFDRLENFVHMLHDIASRDPAMRVKNRNNPTGYWAPQEPIDHMKLLSWAATISTIDMPAKLEALMRPPQQSSDKHPWPYHHDTELLKICRWVIETYWEDSDPNSAPTREAISKELQEKFKIKKGAAYAIDHVARHDSLKATPKKTRG